MSESADRSIVVLIGMPGSGKSTVGALLAARLGRMFIDTDRLIEVHAGCGLPALLARAGVAGFTAAESVALRQAHAVAEESGGAVIATGGSAVYCADEMRTLHERTCIIHLDGEVSVLAERAGDLLHRGVVRQPAQSLAQVFQERDALYRRYAHRRYCATDADAAALCDRIVADCGL